MLCNTVNRNRIWEIDFFRGIAILLMILFHLIVDLKDFYAYNLDYLSGFWYLEGKFSAILFILICGVSSTLGHSSTRHGCKIFMWAIILTAVTYLYNESYFIWFGILHFLGICLLTANFMRKLPITWLLIASCSSIIVGLLFSEHYVTNPYLFPLGLMASTFISMDYYPLFPWYGLFLLGIIIGKIVYADTKKRLGLRQVPHIQWEVFTSLQSIPSLKSIPCLGQHSLGIYLIHQPILLALLYVLHRF